MRRKLLFLATILVIVTVGCLSGCGGCGCESEHETTYVPEHPEDHYTTSDVLPSEEDMGAPLYQENIDPSTVESMSTESNGEMVDKGVDYSTKDDFDTVLSWYKGELGEPGELSQLPGGHWQAAWRLDKNGMFIKLIITCTDEGTAISVLVAKQ